MTFEPIPDPTPSPFRPSLRTALLVILVGLSAVLASLTDKSEAAEALALARTEQPPANAARWNGAQIQWRDFETGLAEAQATGKPIFLQLHATWCGFCRRLSRQFVNPAVVALADRYVMVLADIDRQPTIARAYAHDGGYVPRSMVLTPQGWLVSRIDNNQESYVYALSSRSASALTRMLEEGLAYFEASEADRLAWPAAWSDAWRTH